MPTDFLSTYQKAQQLIKNGQLRDAVGLCRDLLEADRTSPYANFLMSQICLQMGELEKAADFIDLTVEYMPDVAEFQVQRGRVMQRQGFYDGAEMAFLRALEINPELSHLHGELFNVLVEAGKYTEARRVLDTLMAMYPHDPALHHMRASLDGHTTTAAPLEFVAALFNQAAAEYDAHMLENLAYNTPQQLAGALAPLLEEREDLSLLDLGCGTGLVAEMFQDITARRVGVDIAEQMLAHARAKLLYVELYRRDIVEFLMDCKKQYDLVIAADVLVYSGNLVPFFHAARPVLASSGLLAFSFEKDESTDAYRLNRSGRYGHSRSYVQSMLYNEGYELLAMEEVSLRTEGERPVPGVICVARQAVQP